MANDKTVCPIDGCMRQHPRNHLMCNPHWRMVPKELQGIVYKTARKMWNGEENGVEEWEEARRRAIAAVEEKEAERAGHKDPVVSVGEPVDELTALGEHFAEFMEEHGCRGFLMVSKDGRGGVTQTGYEEGEEGVALNELSEHVEVFFSAYGVKLNFVWPEHN